VPGFRQRLLDFSAPGSHLAAPEPNKFAGVDAIACDSELNFHASIFIQNTTPVCNLQQVSPAIFPVILTSLSTGIIFSTDQHLLAFTFIPIAFGNTERTATDVHICVA
jgi:hypothetical protein